LEKEFDQSQFGEMIVFGNQVQLEDKAHQSKCFNKVINTDISNLPTNPKPLNQLIRITRSNYQNPNDHNIHIVQQKGPQY
jgi:hypothetical protein